MPSPEGKKGVPSLKGKPSSRPVISSSRADDGQTSQRMSQRSQRGTKKKATSKGTNAAAGSKRDFMMNTVTEAPELDVAAAMASEATPNAAAERLRDSARALIDGFGPREERRQKVPILLATEAFLEVGVATPTTTETQSAIPAALPAGEETSTAAAAAPALATPLVETQGAIEASESSVSSVSSVPAEEANLPLQAVTDPAVGQLAVVDQAEAAGAATPAAVAAAGSVEVATEVAEVVETASAIEAPLDASDGQPQLANDGEHPTETGLAIAAHAEGSEPGVSADSLDGVTVRARHLLTPSPSCHSVRPYPTRPAWQRCAACPEASLVVTTAAARLCLQLIRRPAAPSVTSLPHPLPPPMCEVQIEQVEAGGPAMVASTGALAGQQLPRAWVDAFAAESKQLIDFIVGERCWMQNPYFRDGTRLRVGPSQEDEMMDRYARPAIRTESEPGECP